MDGKYTGTRYVHSEAEIEARVWYEATKSKTYKQEEKNFTGNSEKRYFIKLNNFQIDEYQETTSIEKEYSYEELKNILVKELEEELSVKTKDKTNPINKQINVKEIDGGIEVQLIYEILENIGEEKKIDINAE